MLNNKEKVRNSPYTSPELYSFLTNNSSFLEENIEKNIIYNVGMILLQMVFFYDKEEINKLAMKNFYEREELLDEKLDINENLKKLIIGMIKPNVKDRLNR